MHSVQSEVPGVGSDRVINLSLHTKIQFNYTQCSGNCSNVLQSGVQFVRNAQKLCDTEMKYRL